MAMDPLSNLGHHPAASAVAGEGPPTATDGDRTVAMHDLLSLGEFAAALSESGGDNDGVDVEHKGIHGTPDDDALLRLPALLRLLHAAQPLASVPTPKSPINFPRSADGGDNGDKREDRALAATADPGRASAVSALERVAATRAPAEGVEAVAAYLSPDACRRIGRCRPLRRVPDSSAISARGGRQGGREGEADGDGEDDGADEGGGGRGGEAVICEWDEGRISDMVSAAAGGPLSSAGRKRRRRIEEGDSGGGESSGAAGGSSGLDDDNEEENDEAEAGFSGVGSEAAAPVSFDDATVEMAAHKRMVAELLPMYQKMVGADSGGSGGGSGKKRVWTSPGPEGGSKREFSDLSSLFRSAKSAEEDSVRSGVGRTLTEVAALVATGLRNPPRTRRRSRTVRRGDREDWEGVQEENEEEDDGHSHRSAMAAVVALPVKGDSVLAEPASEDGGASAAPMGGADLPATVAALMYYAPVIRHEHLSNALCRASVPQASHVVAALAANCPAAVSSILRGCVDAHLAVSSPSPDGDLDASIPQADRAVVRAASASVNRIADLSPAEAWRAVSSLRSAGGESPTGIALALDLTMGRNDEAAAAMILDALMSDRNRRRQNGCVAQTSLIGTSGGVEDSSSEEKGGGEQPSRDGPSRSRVCRQDSRDGDGPDHLTSSKRKRGAAARGRRRIRPLRRRGRVIASADTASAVALGLAKALRRDPDLAGRARACALRCLELEAGGSSGGGGVIWGRAALLVRSCAALVFEIGVGPSSVDGGKGTCEPSRSFAQQAVVSVAKIVARLPAGMLPSLSPPPLTSPCDNFRRSALCLCIVVMARVCPAATSGPGEEEDEGIADENKGWSQDGVNSTALEACLECLLNLLRPSVSGESDAFASRLAGCILARDGPGLLALLEEVLLGEIKPSYRVNMSGNDGRDNNGDADDAAQDLRFLAAIECASSKLGTEMLSVTIERGWSAPAVLADARAMLEAVGRSQLDSDERDAVLKDIFEDSIKCAALFGRMGTVELISSSFKALVDLPSEEHLKVPVLLPLQVEMLSRKISWNQSDLMATKLHCEDGDNATRCQFVMQLLYVLTFAEHFPNSPFAVDPRTLPIGAALVFCRTHASYVSSNYRRGGALSISSALENLASKLCPEVPSIAPDIPVWSSADLTSGQSLTNPAIKVTPIMVSASIRACVHGGDDDDPSGQRSERLFLKCRSDFPSADVDARACAALLSSRCTPPRFHSYSALCRDPLALLRCNVRTWRRRGVRRIMLSILRRLLDSNVFIVRESTPSAAEAEELLAARDAVVARCLLVADSTGYRFESDSKESGSKVVVAPFRCPMAVSLVRSLVSKRPGLTAVLVKQGLPHAAVDLLADMVPETLADAPALAALLSERNTLTGAERLSVADASLRIVVAHGLTAEVEEVDDGNDNPETQKLAFAAMSVLVSSFFLMLGPVGVPVDAVCEEDGRDLTGACRNATFRMINTMQNIGCRRLGLKNEAKLALSKIAGLCKSEGAMGGVAGVAAMKRKALLKEVWDSVMRATNALGGGL